MTEVIGAFVSVMVRSVEMKTGLGVKAGLRAVSIILQIGSGDPLNVTLGALALGESTASALDAFDRPLAKHVRRAAKKLTSITREFDLSDGDQGFVEHSLEAALASKSPVHYLSKALLGRDTFTSGVREDIDSMLPAVDRLSDDQSAYLAQLCSFVHTALAGVLEHPNRLPAPLIVALEDHEARLAGHSARLNAQDRVIRELLDKLGHAGPRIVGSRPRLVEPRVDRGEVDSIVEGVLAGSGAPFVISGMRGVGKSQLAAAVAERFENDSWDLVAWVSSRTREGLVTDLCRIAAAYEIELGFDSTATAAAAVDRLSRPDGEQRLLILDNVERFDDIADLIPSVGTKVVVTTTLTRPPWGTLVPLEPFTPSEAASYLDAAAPGTPPETAAVIASELGHLPLALTQASATMRRLGLSGEAYLDALRRQPITKTLRRFDGDDYPASVEAALAMSIESAIAADGEGGRLAERMLITAAFLSEDGFFAESLLALDIDELAARDARATLLEQGILRSGEHGHRLSMHKLFARLLSGRVEKIDASTVIRDIVTVLAAGPGPGGEDPLSERERVTDVATQLASIVRMGSNFPAVLNSAEIHHLVIAYATAAVEGRMMEAALSLEPWQSAIAAAPSSTIEDVLALPSAIARTHTQAGDAEKGVVMYEAAIEKASSSGVSPLTLAEMSGALASALRHSGRTKASITLGRKTIADLEMLLGDLDPDDLDVARRALLNAKSNLAGALRIDGAPEDAVALYDDVLAMNEINSNPTLHLQVRNNRLQALRSTGTLADAIAAHEDLLDELTASVGEEHAFWVVTHGNMAATIAESEDLARGIETLTDSANRQDRVLGSGNRVSLETRVLLARALLKGGQKEDALEQLRIVYSRACKSVGDEAAVSVRSGFELANALIAAGICPEAVRVGTAVLRVRRDETLNARDTALLRIHLAYAFLELKNPRRARPLLQRGLEDYAAMSSPDAGTLARARSALSILDRDPSASDIVVVGLPPGREDGAAVGSAKAGLAFRRTET